MDINLSSKINRLNELYIKSERGLILSDIELKEQGMLREDLINYFKMIVPKHIEYIDKKNK